MLASGCELASIEAVGEALELPAEALGSMFEQPTTLFRCFHYPPHDDAHAAAARFS